MTTCRVILHGCDDGTEVTLDDVTEDQLSFLTRLADLFEAASDYGCMPTMEIVRVPGGA